MLILFIFNLLLSSAISSKQDISILFSRLTATVFFYAFLLGYNCIYFLSAEKGISLLGGLFHITCLSAIFNIFILILSFILVTLTSYYGRKVWKVTNNTIKDVIFNRNKPLYNINDIYKVINKNSNPYKIVEYALIMVFIITGAILLMTTNDLVSIFLAIELQSYGLYLICCLWRNSEKAVSAGLTYFLLGALSSCLILLGTVLLYVFSGTNNVDILYSLTNIFTTCDFDNSAENLQLSSNNLNVAFTLISVGFLFKISASPFHFWAPDVYDKIPTIVTAFVAIVAKISILVFLFNLVHYENVITQFNSNNSWTVCLLMSCLLSLICGTLLGLKETRIKRLLAFSTVSHLGFILLAICVNSLQSIQAFIFYLIQYSISNINVFFIIIMIGYSLYYHVYDKKEDFNIKDRNNSPIQLLTELKGYFLINPVISLAFTITIFSFVGVPPLLGFFAKQMVLLSALNSGYIFLSLVAILTSVLGAVYYLGIIKYIFFDNVKFSFTVSLKDLIEKCITKTKSDNTADKNTKLYQDMLQKTQHSQGLFKLKHVTISSSLTLVTSVLTLIILLFMFSANESLNLSNIVSLMLFNH